MSLSPHHFHNEMNHLRQTLSRFLLTQNESTEEEEVEKREEEEREEKEEEEDVLMLELKMRL